jgi:hypothetical protein
VPDEAERIAAEQLFISDTASDAERLRIIREFGVTHALANNLNSAPGLMRWLRAKGQLLVAVERYEIYAVPQPAD